MEWMETEHANLEHWIPGGILGFEQFGIFHEHIRGQESSPAFLGFDAHALIASLGKHHAWLFC